MDSTKKASPELTDAVKTYLLARAYRDAKRDQVKPVQIQILKELEIRETTGEIILDSEILYLSNEEDKCQNFYDECDRRLKEAGYKPEGMKHDYCPLLVADVQVTEAGWEVIDTSAAMLNLGDDFRTELLCCGMESYKEFIDLSVGLVLSSDDSINSENLMSSIV